MSEQTSIPREPIPAPYNGQVDAPISRPSYRGLGIAGFVLSFFAVLNIAGLIISIIALVKARRQGDKNGLAIAGIAIASAGILVGAVVLALTVPVLVDAAQTCAELGEGVHVVGNATYTCTSTSFSVYSNL